MKILFDENGVPHEVAHINGYLMGAPDVFVESRSKPLCNVPEMTTGNRPADGGALIIEEDEYDEFVRREPLAKRYLKRLVGSSEFINNQKRWCLWLVGVSPAEIRRMPLVMKRIETCRDNRLSAPDPGRRKLAETPMLFRETKNPKTCIAIPEVSSQNRHYIPIGFLTSETITTNKIKIVQDADLYQFGVLTSSVHNAWMRSVCGRLKSDYSYSNTLVYNNFPWPECLRQLTQSPQSSQSGAKSLSSSADSAFSVSAPAGENPVNPVNPVEKITATAQGILDARALYPDASLADLYDPLTMPPELRKAHAANDAAVLAAYGFGPRATESEIVARLFGMYEKLTKKERT